MSVPVENITPAPVADSGLERSAEAAALTRHECGGCGEVFFSGSGLPVPNGDAEDPQCSCCVVLVARYNVARVELAQTVRKWQAQGLTPLELVEILDEATHSHLTREQRIQRGYRS